MKKLYFTSTSIFWLLLLGTAPVFSQSDVSGLIKSGPDDTKRLAQAYLKPLFKGLGVGLNSGWNNSANSKNLLRFDLRMGLTGAVVPPKDETFDVTKIGLSNNLRPTNPSQTISPTISGGSGNTQLTVYNSNDQALETFTLPKGTGIPLIPAPQLQGTIGLPRGIDFTLRAMPKINLGKDLGSIDLLGAGVKLEILPLISGTLNTLFPLDIALAVGYTQFSYQVPLNVPQPSGSQPASPGQSQDFSNQRIEAKFSGLNTEAIISKKILLFIPFLSVGYHNSKTDAGLKGNYPIITGANLLGQRTYTVFTDPVNINQTDISGFRTNIGFRLNLAFFRIYGSYSMAEYNSFNGGIGFGIGK